MGVPKFIISYYWRKPGRLPTSLKDVFGKNLGRFYGQELQKANILDYFLVEKNLNTKKVNGRTRYFCEMERIQPVT